MIESFLCQGSHEHSSFSINSQIQDFHPERLRRISLRLSTSTPSHATQGDTVLTHFKLVKELFFLNRTLLIRNNEC